MIAKIMKILGVDRFMVESKIYFCTIFKMKVLRSYTLRM